MKPIIFLVAMLGLAVVGCGNNECEDAAEKLEGCNFEGYKTDEDKASECNEDAECLAKCVNAASCSDMKPSFEDPLNATANDFTACSAKCGG
jgi:hypothetical protein